MSQLIGIKEIFAIQYEITNPASVIGKVCLWINNIKMGNYNDEVYLSYISDSLNNVINKKNQLVFSEFENLNDKNIFDILLQKNIPDSEKLSKYDITIVHLGESFDGYIIRVIERKGGFVILWRMVTDSNKEVFSGFIPSGIMTSVYSNYKEKVFENS